MTRFRPQHEVYNYFHYRMAIIQVGFGETSDDAWHRHLEENPEDIYTNIRVFNHQLTENK